jgi:uncharacterized protein (TIGR03435 family)
MRTIGAFSAFLFLSTGAIAQPRARPEFEVATIKPAAPGARGMFIRPTPGGRVNITNMPLKELIVIAYRVQRYQISGGPSWLESNRYDISAKAENDPKEGELPLMIQALLADRFQLTIRRETKELPIYALVMAKKDGKLGPGLMESKEGGCTAFDPLKPPPPLEPGKNPARWCGNMMMGPGTLRAVSIPVAQIARCCRACSRAPSLTRRD